MRGILVGAACVLMLAGCSAGPRSTEPGVTTYAGSHSPTAQVPTPKADDPHDRVLFVQLADDPSWATADRTTLITKAHQVCDRVTDGGGNSTAKADVLSRLMDAGIPLVKATDFMVASFTAYCPEHLALLR